MVKDRDGPAVFVPGTCIGRYRIDSELGRGGTSVVYLATDLHLGKQWAVKVILQEGSGVRKGNSVPEAAGSMSALLEEAELMKRLDHPALPRIIDILEQDGMLILVMDYVKEDNLASLLARAGPFGESIVREWMYQLAAVLEYLHGQ
ncbi:MAG: protein kinase, partial [Eubacterium sp.]|nr:protein kinase [Eubacterium sp.]